MTDLNKITDQLTEWAMGCFFEHINPEVKITSAGVVTCLWSAKDEAWLRGWVLKQDLLGLDFERVYAAVKQQFIADYNSNVRDEWDGESVNCSPEPTPQPAPSAPEVGPKVGKVVRFSTPGGLSQMGRIVSTDPNIKNGKPGFVAVPVEVSDDGRFEQVSDETMWGYDEQINRVF